MRNFREAIRQKRPDLWKNKNWLLHHDYAPAHTSLLVRDFLAKNNPLMMLQPYSPDLAPCDFFLFPKLKRPMKGRCYATLDEIKTASKEELKKIRKNDFLKCFEDWKNRWHKCIISHGDYFEGDKIAVIYKAVKQDGGMARKDFIKQLALQLMRDALNMNNQAKNLSRDLQVLIQKLAGTSSLETYDPASPENSPDCNYLHTESTSIINIRSAIE
ncbi:hypothetical protein LAZ67_12000763 [Cordylochernes scorpioides]|uniref:Transposase n=1 Tax=Cordylochernes scorpioides TaxID=51811 RepID=A0ABY6L0R3_9ARAC|nr:hypothetical protein LAZ67_12000763 [Cordylochernes scorpioides]